MSLIFRKEKTPAELLLENKRMFDRSIRDIERKKQGLQAEEQKLIAEMAAVKVMTKDLIRTSIRLQSFMPSNHSSKVYLLEFSLLEHTTRIRLLAAFNEISVAEMESARRLAKHRFRCKSVYWTLDLKSLQGAFDRPFYEC